MSAQPLSRAIQRPAKPRPSPWIAVGILASVLITAWAASDEFGVGFSIAEILGNLTRGERVVGELLTPNWAFIPQTIPPLLETVKMAVIASVIGCGVALPAAFLASRVSTPSRLIYLADRSVLNVIRALPDLLYALVFVTAIGIGPLAGILALILFNIGVTAKLLSETIDGVDQGPSEAAWAGGASRTQMMRTAIFPQVLPNYVAYALYVFELNVRASTVIGLVGAGGMGFLLQVQLSFFAYENVAVIIAELFAAVFLIELISIRLRRRLV